MAVWAFVWFWPRYAPVGEHDDVFPGLPKGEANE